MSRYMNYDSTSIPKGRSVGDKMPLFENEEVERLKEHIRELQTAVHDLLITDKPAAWRLHLGESRYEEIKALEPPHE